MPNFKSDAPTIPRDKAEMLFAELVATKTVTERGCWVKPGERKRKNRYVNVHARPFAIHAHRLAFFVTNGYLPPVVRHECDYPPCFRPDHLVGGTQADNLNDMTAKGRRMDASGRRWMYRGEENRRIPVARVGEFLTDGWKIGRSRQFGVGRPFTSRSWLSG